jgi:DNA-directed RNA polymerase subunit RPC12/RpoP
MIETETTWNDSGYDCDHCGGQILERTDIETGQPARVCYQCQACGCQWQLDGDVLRVGSRNSCRRAQRVRVNDQAKEQISPNQLRLAVGIGIVVLLGIIFFGGLVAIRFLIPVAIAIFVVRAVYQLGKERMWW